MLYLQTILTIESPLSICTIGHEWMIAKTVMRLAYYSEIQYELICKQIRADDLFIFIHSIVYFRMFFLKKENNCSKYWILDRHRILELFTLRRAREREQIKWKEEAKTTTTFILHNVFGQYYKIIIGLCWVCVKCMIRCTVHNLRANKSD